MRICCPRCFTLAPWAPPEPGIPVVPGPAPTEEIDPCLIPVRCVQPRPVSRQLRRALGRDGKPLPVCGEEFLVRAG